MINDSVVENLGPQNTTSNAKAVLTQTVSATENTFQLTIFGLVFVLSVVGNTAMMAVLFKGCRVRSYKNALLLNMIVAESAVTMTSIPVDFVLILLDKGWLFGSVMCHVLWPLQTAPFGALVLTLTAMSIQHFKGIVQRLRKTTSDGDFSSRTTVALIWVFSLTIVIPYGAFLRFEDGECVETWGRLGSQIYTVSLFVFHYAIPLAVITFCYARIAIRIRRGHLEGDSIISGTCRARLKRSKRHVRAVRMVVLFVAVFAVCMLPHQVVWLWIAFGKNVEYPVNLLTFAYMFTFTSSFANPLVYFTHNPSFRARLLTFLCCGSALERRYGNSSTTAS
ncbi:galanin receptor type 1-like [Montipora capricornis]|uniref:galanin receptor type 1-like n=1 Tax=Montipora capricornis TaxID=246305 RepID=UPI0035F1A7D0